MWRSVRPSNCPPDSSSYFCPKNSICHQQKAFNSPNVCDEKKNLCDGQLSRLKLQWTFPQKTASVLLSVWTTNGVELANHRCGVNVASQCESGYLEVIGLDLDWKLCHDSAHSHCGVAISVSTHISLQPVRQLSLMYQDDVSSSTGLCSLLEIGLEKKSSSSDDSLCWSSLSCSIVSRSCLMYVKTVTESRWHTYVI